MKTNKKAISLIVLVVTIIVMGILATTVIISLSNTNIIEQASDTTFKANVQSYNTALELYVADQIMRNPSYDRSSLNVTDSNSQIFKDIFGEGVNIDTGDSLKVINGYLYYETTDESKNDVLEELGQLRWKFVENAYGQKVQVTNGNYTLDIGVQLKGYGQFRWRILGASDSGELLITSEENVSAIAKDPSTGKVALGSSLMAGTFTLPEMADALNKACETYLYLEKGAIKARALNAEDINNLTTFKKSSYIGETPMENYGTTVNFTWIDGYPAAYYGTQTESQAQKLTEVPQQYFYEYNKSEGSVSKITAGAKISSITNNFYKYRIKNYMDSTVYSRLFPEYYNTQIYLPDIVVRANLERASYGLQVLVMSDAESNLGLQMKPYTFVKSNGITWDEAGMVLVRPVVHLKADIALTGNNTAGWRIDI
ncbi:MAG: type II secretion system protein [Clostridia bacterium]|nr:type II secretion system protein [Clostridia bacterium]